MRAKLTPAAKAAHEWHCRIYASGEVAGGELTGAFQVWGYIVLSHFELKRTFKNERCMTLLGCHEVVLAGIEYERIERDVMIGPQVAWRGLREI